MDEKVCCDLNCEDHSSLLELHHHLLTSVPEEEWIKSLERIHGGPISSEKEIIDEEIKHNMRGPADYSEMSVDEIASWAVHYQQEIADFDSEENDPVYLDIYEEQLDAIRHELNARHSTWHTPGQEALPQDEACYCGWLGQQQPCPTFAPPLCTCIDRSNLPIKPDWLCSLLSR